MRAFQRSFRPAESTTILDVGGTPFNWELAGIRSQLTLLNLSPPRGVDATASDYRFVEGSGTQLEFADRAFDVVFSNSVIEHLGSWEQQRAFAREVRRVARGLWVQTPARGFPIEPHLMTPLLHYLPVGWQRRLLRNFSVWGLVARPSQEAVEGFLEQTRLLDFREMRELFPDCEIRRERFLGLTKSYVAIRLAAPVR
jgi:hypothetical protein